MYCSQWSSLHLRIDRRTLATRQTGWSADNIRAVFLSNPFNFALNCLLQVVISLHVLLYFSDSLPPLQTIFSVACHVVYLQNFSHTWPLISLTSPSFLASCVLVIADHFIWFFHFARITNEARHLRTYRGLTVDVPNFTEIASFFGLCVWLAPLFLFLSLSANDNALPMSACK